MNKDFKAGQVEAQDIAQLIALKTSGNISRDTLWKELVRHNALSEDFDPEAEAERLEGEEEADMERQAEAIRMLDNSDGSDEEDDDS